MDFACVNQQGRSLDAAYSHSDAPMVCLQQLGHGQHPVGERNSHFPGQPGPRPSTTCDDGASLRQRLTGRTSADGKPVMFHRMTMFGQGVEGAWATGRQLSVPVPVATGGTRCKSTRSSTRASFGLGLRRRVRRCRDCQREPTQWVRLGDDWEIGHGGWGSARKVGKQ
jgi:hypothetical protein